ncbi:MAG: peptidase domain-containing ABC transporter [Gammaproteobacteria bacterium]|nr:peptidase domain-containing ABC transporter [Gammaproteobacteria bacterium]
MTGENLKRLNFGARRLPLIRQNETTECGLACLAMVAGFHGFRTDIAALRRRFPTSVAGVTLSAIMEMAARMEMNCRALKVPLEDIRKLRTPAIVHWDMNHFVVLKSAGAKKMVVHDPAVGVRRHTRDSFSRHFTGVALELHPAKGFERKEERARLRLNHLWTRIRGLRRTLAQALVLSAILQLFVLVSPFYLQLTVDEVLVKFDADLLWVLAFGFGGLAVLNAVAGLLRGYVLLYFGNMLNYQMVCNLFAHLVQLPADYFEKRHIGDIVSRFGSVGPIRSLFTEGLVATAIDGVMAVATLVMMFLYSPVLGSIALVALALYLVLRVASYSPLRARSEDAIVFHAREQSFFMETVRGVLSIKLFGREVDRRRVWQNRLADAVNADVRVQKLVIWFDLGNSAIFGIEHVVLIYVAAKMTLNAEFTVGMIFAYMAYKRQFTDKALALVERLIEFRMLELHLSRISDIALTEREPATLPSGIVRNGAALRGGLRLEAVSYRYGEALPEVFRGVNIDIEAGETIAFVGSSGSGKTTLMKIMLGLFEPTAGRVLIDGRPLSDVGVGEYRRHVGSVMQEDALFAGSIAENIAFFDSEMDMARVVHAAELACIHDGIAAKPMGYETLVGDMGSALSGGEKQRILLARALYRRPKILFMDEGTSNLDVATERDVNASIRSLGVTRIIVAHRPETIRTADRVAALVDGRLVETDAA